MTIEREGSELVATCDGCGCAVSEADIDVEGFDAVVGALKEDGWWFVREGGSWTHLCPDCQ